MLGNFSLSMLNKEPYHVADIILNREFSLSIERNFSEKKNPPTIFSIRSLNIAILYSRLLVSQDRQRDYLFKACRTYRETVGGLKGTKDDFYSNVPSNNYLESEFKNKILEMIFR